MFEFVWTWFTGILDFLVPFWSKKKGTILFLGLDNAGKTTLLGRLRDDRMVSANPTPMPHSEQLELGNTTFTAYDLGGHPQVRRVWRTYFPVANGVVFVLDAADRERFPEARAELDALLSDEEIVDLPIAILANKIDLSGAAGEEDINVIFGLQGLLTGKGKVKGDELRGRRPLEVFNCSVLGRQGYGKAFLWLAEYV